MAPLGYSGRKRDTRHAYTMYALAFDLDEPKLEKVLSHARAEYGMPRPTYIVLSGHGLHLYYHFDEPIPLYPRNKVLLKELKHALTVAVWNVNTSRIEKPQYQGINQAFRLVGSPSKLGVDYPVRAWRIGQPVVMEHLREFVYRDEYKERLEKLWEAPKMSLDEAKEKYPDWWARVCKMQSVRQQWVAHRGLYDWWQTKWDNATRGHRYFYIMCLAVFARKCGIGQAELKADAMRIRELLDTREEDPFTTEDIRSALKAYTDDYTTFTRDVISKLTAIPITPARRNGRSQEQHLMIARAIRDALYPDGLWREGNGRPDKAMEVVEWRLANPNGRKIDCERDTGLSRHTVLKWWSAIEGQPL